jgi:hypothetical protein
LPQQEVESRRHPSSVPQLEVPPAPPQATPVAGGDPDRDDDNGDSSSHNTELSEEQELEGWVARPITRDATRGCHFHNALNTLLCWAFDRHTVAEPPELFQLKCPSPALEATTHLNRNKLSIPRIWSNKATYQESNTTSSLEGEAHRKYNNHETTN